MILLIFKILLQVLAFGVALSLGLLDYWFTDKRTRRFKRARKAFVVVAVGFLIGSIVLTVIDDFENRRKEEELRGEVAKVQKQNDGLQAGIAALTDKSAEMLNEQRSSFVSVLEDQRRTGLETSNTIRSASDLLQSSIRQTISQQKRTLDSITGGDSFCYLRLLVANDTAQIVIVPQGTTPLYGVHFRLWEPARYQNVQAEQFRQLMQQDYVRVLGDLSTHGVLVLEPSISLGRSTSKEFAVEIGARNGYVHERIKLVNINGSWGAAYKVTKQVGNKTRTLLEETDPLLVGKIKW